MAENSLQLNHVYKCPRCRFKTKPKQLVCSQCGTANLDSSDVADIAIGTMFLTLSKLVPIFFLLGFLFVVLDYLIGIDSELAFDIAILLIAFDLTRRYLFLVGRRPILLCGACGIAVEFRHYQCGNCQTHFIHSDLLNQILVVQIAIIMSAISILGIMSQAKILEGQDLRPLFVFVVVLILWRFISYFIYLGKAAKEMQS